MQPVVTFHSCFLSIIYVRASYQMTYLLWQLHISVYSYHPCFLFSPSSLAVLLSCARSTLCSNVCTKPQAVIKKKMHYTAIFVKIWSLTKSCFFKGKHVEFPMSDWYFNYCLYILIPSNKVQSVLFLAIEIIAFSTQYYCEIWGLIIINQWNVLAYVQLVLILI